MKTIPKQIRTRLEAMSLADLDVMATVCGKAVRQKNNMEIRVEWISAIMTEKMVATFNTTTPMTTIPFNIEHCGHCALRTPDKDDGRGDRCYIFEVKDVSENVRDKTMNEHCPLRKCKIVFKAKEL